MFNKIKILRARWKLRKWFTPAENHELSRIGNLYGVPRYVFLKKVKGTEDYPVFVTSVKKTAYLENDEHYRKRINSNLNLK